VFGPVCCEQAQRFGHHVRADAVVDAARHDPGVGKLLNARVEHAGVSQAHALERFGLARGPDVDPQVRDLRDFVHVLALHQVHRLLPDHPMHRTLGAADHHALPHEDLGVPAPMPANTDIPRRPRA